MTNLIEKKNYEYCQKTIELKKDIESVFMEFAARLYNIREERLYEPSWGSFPEFCMEMDLDYTKASRLCSIHEKFIVEYGFATSQIVEAGGWTKVAEILPVIKSQEDAKHWLHVATSNTIKDIRDSVIEERKGRPMLQCKHEDFYIIKVCRDCGLRVREYDGN